MRTTAGKTVQQHLEIDPHVMIHVDRLPPSLRHALLNEPKEFIGGDADKVGEHKARVAEMQKVLDKRIQY